MDSTFSERLSDLMFERNVKSHELAAAIGVNTATVNDWKRGKFQMYLSNLVKVADFFGCSLEFLMGRSETPLDYTPKPLPPFYPRFRAVMKERGKTRYRMPKESDIKDSYFTEWNKGSDPLVVSLIKAADYIGVTLDYLVGRDS